MSNEMERVLWDAMLYALEGEDPSKAIENQEKRGQQKICQAGRLPKKTNDVGLYDTVIREGMTDEMSYEEKSEIRERNLIKYTKEKYEQMGIQLGESDDLFYDVILPDGWKIVPTSHSMWNNLIDDKGKEVAQFFYKSSFYDSDAFINFTKEGE